MGNEGSAVRGEDGTMPTRARAATSMPSNPLTKSPQDHPSDDQQSPSALPRQRQPTDPEIISKNPLTSPLTSASLSNRPPPTPSTDTGAFFSLNSPYARVGSAPAVLKFTGSKEETVLYDEAFGPFVTITVVCGPGEPRIASAVEDEAFRTDDFYQEYVNMYHKSRALERETTVAELLKRNRFPQEDGVAPEAPRRTIEPDPVDPNKYLQALLDHIRRNERMTIMVGDNGDLCRLYRTEGWHDLKIDRRRREDSGSGGGRGGSPSKKRKDAPLIGIPSESFSTNCYPRSKDEEQEESRKGSGSRKHGSSKKKGSSGSSGSGKHKHSHHRSSNRNSRQEFGDRKAKNDDFYSSAFAIPEKPPEPILLNSSFSMSRHSSALALGKSLSPRGSDGSPQEGGVTASSPVTEGDGGKLRKRVSFSDNTPYFENRRPSRLRNKDKGGAEAEDVDELDFHEMERIVEDY